MNSSGHSTILSYYLGRSRESKFAPFCLSEGSPAKPMAKALEQSTWECQVCCGVTGLQSVIEGNTAYETQ